MRAEYDADQRTLAELAFDHATVATAVFDVSAPDTFGRIVAVNGVFARWFGRDQAQLRGIRGESLTADYGTWRDAVERAVARGSAQAAGVTVRRLGSDPLLADLLVTAVDDSSLVVAELIDRSPHERGLRALRESERRLREIVENVQALVWVKDLDGCYVLMNRRCQTVFGIAPGMVDFEWAPEHSARQYIAHDREVLGVGRPMEFLEDVFEAGSTRTYLSLKFPLYDDQGRPYALAGIATDVTAVKQAEIAASEARDEAERASRAKSELLSRTSHELRTPLNSILGYAQLLAMGGDGIAVEEASAQIIRAGRHLSSMIDDVLQIARIDEGGDEVVLQPVHACDPLGEAVEIVRPIADAQGISIAVDLHRGVLTFVRGNHRRLKQVLINLLDNAVRYNGAGQPIHVSFEQEGDELRFCVSDRGAGLPDDAAERVFAPFDRLHRNGTDGGSGLGLAVSRALVESMNGRLWYRPRPGGGTTFVVQLPIADTPADAAAAMFAADAWPAVTPAMSVSARVLYIEDNADNVDVVRRALGALGVGIELEAAASAEAGLRTAAGADFDVVLLDLHLPDRAGREIIGELRATARRDRLPIIVLSADATRDQIDATMSAGADAYLTKPLDLADLLSTVVTALSP